MLALEESAVEDEDEDALELGHNEHGSDIACVQRMDVGPWMSQKCASDSWTRRSRELSLSPDNEADGVTGVILLTMKSMVEEWRCSN